MNRRSMASASVAGAEIDGRRVEFTPLPFQARLRVTFYEVDPAVLGSVIDLDTDEPGLRVSAPLHLEWGNAHADQLVTEATRIWASLASDCEG
ncbi:hypothetical protein [Glycomyces salinus]|uniref:hypothetical protein n=1 Tax=Glycomyces salinus TaxID=980294 RepID=UPI0018EB8F5F|nr:hypothetical protein [Glycomyces salinus]